MGNPGIVDSGPPSKSRPLQLNSARLLSEPSALQDRDGSLRTALLRLRAGALVERAPAPHGGTITKIAASDGVTLMQGEPILFIEPAEVDGDHTEEETTVDLDHIRADLAEVIARHANTLDASRPASVERRRKTNQRTTRENITQLVDAGSFVEYGSLAIAAQRRRRKLDDLIKNTPADGLITGVATINADKVGAQDGTLYGDRLRLHRAGRYPGPYEPQEDRPHALPRPNSGGFRWCFMPKAAAAVPATPTGSA